MRNKSLVALLSMFVLAAGLSSNSLLSSGSAAGAGTTPDTVLNFYPDNFYDDGTGTYSWDQDVFLSASSSDLYSAFSCPSTASGASVFVAAQGRENSRSGWTAYSTTFLNGTKKVVSPNAKLSGLTIGNVSDIKSVGGAWVLGLACTENSGAFVDFQFTRTIYVTRSTGDWTGSSGSSTGPSSSGPGSTGVAGSSDEKVYTFKDSAYVAENTNGVAFAWDADIVGGPSSSNTAQPFTCPGNSTGAFVFISDLGSERTPASWYARKTASFIPNSQSVLQPVLNISSLNLGSTAYVKSVGGSYSFGLSCTTNNGGTAIYASFRVINVTPVTGAWTAGQELGGTITPTYTPPSNSSSSSSSASPSSSTKPSSSPSAGPTIAPIVPVVLPSWLGNNTLIYQANIRQMTPAGNFAAFQNSQLMRLKRLGVGILNFTPVTPISGTKHFGTLGSQYSVDDYHYVNPELLSSTGSESQFTELVSRAHLAGLKVIIGWNAQATGLDNPWLKNHPDWYQLDGNQKPLTPQNGLGLEKDKALLNFSSPGLREAMVFEMSYWVSHFGVDGFSCANVANVPADYWDRITAQVNAQAPSKLLWLADSYSSNASKNAFAAGYNVPLFQTLNQLGAGKLTPAKVIGSVTASQNVPANNLLVNYTNTDILSDVIGSDVKRLGAATKLGSVLTFTSPGVPMIYNGQEVGLSDKIKANDKSTIKWPAADAAKPYTDFYQKLILLRKNNSALGLSATTISTLKTSSKTVFAFVRKSGNNRVIVIGNLSAKPIKKVVIYTDSATGSYFNFDTTKAVSLGKTLKMKMPKFGYVVLSSQLAG